MPTISPPASLPPYAGELASLQPLSNRDRLAYSPPVGQKYPKLLGELTELLPLTNGQRLAKWYDNTASADNKVRHVFRTWSGPLGEYYVQNVS